MRPLKTGDDLILANHLFVYLGPLLLFGVPFSPVLSTRASKQALTHHTVIFYTLQPLGIGAANHLVSFGTFVHSAFSPSCFLSISLLAQMATSADTVVNE